MSGHRVRNTARLACRRTRTVRRAFRTRTSFHAEPSARRNSVPPEKQINARGKKVLVIGGGDTGSDCVGTANRHGAASVTQIEIMPCPPEGYNPATPWPMYPQVLKTSSSHEEGCTRRWNLATNRFIGSGGVLTGVETEEVEWTADKDTGRPQRKNRQKGNNRSGFGIFGHGFRTSGT